jgi:hypothetical protein
MLAKSSILSQRDHLPTMCIPVVLLEEGFNLQNSQFRLEVGGSPTQLLWFHEVCLWKQQPEERESAHLVEQIARATSRSVIQF